MSEEFVITSPPIDQRYLIIKPWGFGFWSDVHDIWGKLLLAEITNRVPIVIWGEDSLYSLGQNYNSFEQYYLPVSDCTVGDVVNDKFTYYPLTWKFTNIFHIDPKKFLKTYRDVPSFINCEANVLVSDTYHYAYEFMPYLKPDHPTYGLSEDDVYRYINQKYLRVQPDIAQEIDEFYHAHMETGPILAAHIRGGLPMINVPKWSEVNAQYPHEIECYLLNHPSARIFLMTDDQTIFEQYKEMYGDILIYTDCTRKTSSDTIELCLKAYPDRRRKGIEIIKDSYLAARCDSFIGNWGSGVSRAINRLKHWEKDKIKLLW